MYQSFVGQLALSSIVSQSITPTTTKTFMLTQEQSLRLLPLPYGQSANSAIAGHSFEFYMAGLITTPATGTLIIDPSHGNGASTTTGGTSLGASPAQTVTASLATKPYEISGRLTYRIPSMTLTTTTAWLTGTFRSQGTLATAGGGWVIPFGGVSTSVDTTGTAAAGLWGGLNFYVTFSVTGGTITVEQTMMHWL